MITPDTNTETYFEYIAEYNRMSVQDVKQEFLDLMKNVRIGHYEYILRDAMNFYNMPEDEIKLLLRWAENNQPD